jgi:hypothetical protein
MVPLVVVSSGLLSDAPPQPEVASANTETTNISFISLKVVVPECLIKIIPFYAPVDPEPAIQETQTSEYI